MSTKMKILFAIGGALALVLPATGQHPDQQVRISSEGWTISADPDACSLVVAHDHLGPVLTLVRLNIQTGQGLVPAQSWTVASNDQGGLLITTVQPQCMWRLETDR